jgi:hypothetical protein
VEETQDVESSFSHQFVPDVKNVDILHHDTLHQLPPDAKSAFQLMLKIISIVVS